MQKRTKIVATLGPSTDKPGVLEQLIRCGVNVVRLNFSHAALQTTAAERMKYGICHKN